MNKEREILEDYFTDIFSEEGIAITDKLIEIVLRHFELKRKKLPVRIETNYWAKDIPETYGMIWDVDKHGLRGMREFKTKQEAIDFCNEYGLEVIE